MRLLFLFIFLAQFERVHAQEIKLSEDYHSNGNKHWQGYYACNSNGKSTYCTAINSWIYWYENGNIESEEYYENDQRKFVNMWLPDGVQILKNGAGIYVTTEPFSDFVEDSCIYEITDSLRNGFYKRYCKDNNSISLCETGYYKNDRKNGAFILIDALNNTKRIQTFTNDEETGPYTVTTLNDDLLECGQKFKGKKERKYYYFYASGNVKKSCNYQDNVLTGAYIEYYENGHTKVMGQFAHTSAMEPVSIIDPISGQESIVYQMNHATVCKDGNWKYYDASGNLQEEKLYNCELINE